MGVPLAEYRTVRSVRESVHSRVYEAVSERDGLAVIAKVFDLTDEADEYRVQLEFERIRDLGVEGVVRARELQRVGDQLVLIFDRAPGTTLADYCHERGGALELDVFFDVAVALADILARTHAARIVHRDIKPTNVRLAHDAGDRAVMLADFGISVLLEHERRHIYDSEVFLGSLPYISPEQTGRTGQSVDARTDLYSLGVTFYEALTGHLPFENLPPLELIHAHLARVPDPPRALRRELPEGLSRLIARLLAKAPERRYQSAQGLAADLRELRERHRAGLDDADFELGRHDQSASLRVPQSLYGRRSERAKLARCLDAVAGARARKLVVIRGPAGVGKSELAQSLETELVGHGGYFVRGSFEAEGQVPHAALAQALNQLFEQFLTESEVRLTRWRQRLAAGLGGLTPVLAELAPRLSLIVGPQPAPAPLDATASANRLLVAVERVFELVDRANALLVMVLEDAHHAGRESLELLDGLAHNEHGAVLLALTVRERSQAGDAPIDAPVQALCQTLERLPHASALRLDGLDSSGVVDLLGACLGRVDEAEALAGLIQRKTGGVPLFVTELLERLIAEGGLRLADGRWQWTRAQVEAAPVPDDAGALLGTRVACLSPAHQDVLSRAAVIGMDFDAGLVHALAGGTREAVTEALFEAEAAGLLSHAGRGLRFAHDSIRAAARARLDPPTRRALRWRVGQSLLRANPDPDARLFEIVDHLDAGAPDALDEDQARELAALDLRAGQRALGTGAHDLALRYLGHGCALLEPWRPAIAEQGERHRDYALGFRLHSNRAYALALSGERDAATEAYSSLVEWRLSSHHLGEVAARRVRLLWISTRHQDALELGRAVLARLGLRLPTRLSKPRVVANLLYTWRRVRAASPATWLALEPCTDPRAGALTALVSALKYPAFVTDTKLFLYLVALHPRMILDGGYHPTAALAVGDLSIGISGRLGRVAAAARLQDLARDLARREPTGAVEAQVLGVSGSLSLHRSRSFAEVTERFAHGYAGALEAGEFNAAGFLAGFGNDMQLELGTHLRVLERQCLRAGQEVGRRCANQMRVELWLLRGLCQALRGLDLDDEADLGPSWNLDPETIAAAGGAPTNVCVGLIFRAMVELIMDEPQAALATISPAMDTLESVAFNTWYVARGAVIFDLAHSLCTLRGLSTPPQSRARARRALRVLERWAWGSRSNYGHYRDLALGLRQACRGRTGPAVTLLDAAWRQAKARGCRWIEGLAAEQLAEVLEHEAVLSLNEGAQRRAYAAYAAWGAEAKLRRLRERWPESAPSASTAGALNPFASIADSSASLPASGSSTASRSGSRSGSTDYADVLMSVGTIGDDLRLEEVVSRTLDAALTVAGASSGLVVLERDDDLRLVASAAEVGAVRLNPSPPSLRDEPGAAPRTVLHFALRTAQPVVLDEAGADPRFSGDPYLETTAARSLIAVPLIRNERRLGALLLENHLASHGFSETTVETLELVTGHAARFLETAQLYAALHSSEARWRSLVDGAPDFIALLDERGRVVFRNHPGPLVGLIEVDADDHGGEVLVAESSARWRGAVTQVLEQGERRELELEYHDRQLDARWLNVRLAPMALGPLPHAPASELTRRNVVVVASDVTARRRAELDRQSLEAQLRQQQRLESLGTLASGVAHEINNPMQGIMNYAELIKLNPTEPRVIIEFAGEIDHEANRVATIVRNLLAFSRQEKAADEEVINLAAVVEATLSLIRTLLRSDQIDIEVQVRTDVPQVRCRSQQIQQVVMNLVTNARDALNERFDEYDERKRIELRVEHSARPGWVSILVEDWGGGIPPQVLPRIFDPFYTTKGRDQGTGLGLAVSHGIVKDHGGELTVETVIGEGTCFTLDLPSVELEAKAKAEATELGTE